MICSHSSVACINPYEHIRKYRCNYCAEVMMCECDKTFALCYLPHQIAEGTELRSQTRTPVTLGFQPNICNACCGLAEEPAPKAAMYGRTSKIYQYYWREIDTETIRRFADWAVDEGYTDWLLTQQDNKDKYSAFEREVVEEIKALHLKSPKYVYDRKSQNEIISEFEVEIVNLDGVYLKTADRKAKIIDGDLVFTAEEFVANYYQQKGYKVIFAESVPFHTLFGVLMWLLIQDPSDGRNHVVAFGDRIAFEEGRDGELVWIVLPDDFGSNNYFYRREEDIKNYLENLPEEKNEIIWMFDYWVYHSYQFRQYLWVHKGENVEIARKILEVLPVKIIKEILRYLVKDYWHHYIGWPDLLVYQDGNSDFFFVEVKSSSDKLSNDRKVWIENNFKGMKLPFKIVKIHKKAVLDVMPKSTNQE
jgi:hypothetical protein